MRAHERAAAARQVAEAELAAAARMLGFGPVIEQVIQARATGTNQFLDLDTGKLVTPSAEIASALAASEPGEALDVRTGSQRFQHIVWLRESGADLMFAGDGKLIGFDGLFGVPLSNKAANDQADWDDVRPQQVREMIAIASKRGIGPVVTLLTRDRSDLWVFKTRDGSMGVLQIVGFTDEPAAVKIRYKRVNSDAAVAAEAREDLESRLEAASMMTNQNNKDGMLARLAQDAAKAGEAEIVERVLGQITNFEERDGAAIGSVRSLAKRGLRKEALEIAKGIASLETRDQALAELADGERGPKKAD